LHGHGGGLGIMLNPPERSLADGDAGPSPCNWGESKTAPRFSKYTHTTRMWKSAVQCNVLGDDGESAGEDISVQEAGRDGVKKEDIYRKFEIYHLSSIMQQTFRNELVLRESATQRKRKRKCSTER